MHHTQTRVVLEIHRRRSRGLCAGGDSSSRGSRGSGRRAAAGTVKSAAGAKMSGVTVSAKMDNSTITTSVFTDEDGAYYFPAMTAGHYDVWAQADGFETARGDAGLSPHEASDFILNATKDFAAAAVGRPDARVAARPDAGRPPPEARRSATAAPAATSPITFCRTSLTSRAGPRFWK